MEKKRILEFLDTHWEELSAPVTGTHPDTCIPDEVHEFAERVLHRIAGSRRIAADSAEKKEDSAAGHFSASAEVRDSDTKGLLGKAATFRRNQGQYGSDSSDSIINENGLFFVQKQAENTSLDPVFKKLVDSVL